MMNKPGQPARITETRSPNDAAGLARLRVLLTPLAALVGPAAVIAAGSMGTGSTASLVLAGAWFRYDLLWVAIITLPSFIAILDSAARVGVLSGGKGMLSIIREQTHPALMWLVFALMVLVHLFVAMGQWSVMASSFLSIFGYYPPADQTISYATPYWIGEAVLIALLAAGVLALLLSGGYERLQKVMTGLLLLMFFCFLAVAFRGFQEWREILAGLVPRIPADLPVPGTDTSRSAAATIAAIAGGTLAPGAILGYLYLAVDNRASPEQFGSDLRKTILNLGFIFGGYSVLVLVAGGFALFPLPLHAEIAEVHQAGQVLTRALPASFGDIEPAIFALGLFVCGLTTLVVIVQIMTYLCLDAFGRRWDYTRDNRGFRFVLTGWILVPALLAPFWTFPALLKIILLMGVNLFVAPVGIVILLYLVNKRRMMGGYRAGPVRNLLLVAGVALALTFAIDQFYRFFRPL